ncbi:hypothetical protein PR202_gb29469 [Eleusine coracana subsp. coracana]|uniref:Uncharacterized protein n=1 Tax=Eleusine coracana subsp. coracana TaxID=191504 RepID=A0AAV5FX40_ELECO|nr:hypothetical protein PR202_gb29469 [Eleusine coracana subsp. coracana]
MGGGEQIAAAGSPDLPLPSIAADSPFMSLSLPRTAPPSAIVVTPTHGRCRELVAKRSNCNLLSAYYEKSATNPRRAQQDVGDVIHDSKALLRAEVDD